MIPDSDDTMPSMPTETEIYILPNGEIIVADLPAELATQIAQFLHLESIEQGSTPTDDADTSDFA